MGNWHPTNPKDWFRISNIRTPVVVAMRNQRKPGTPEWSRKIEALRRSLTHSQSSFANELNTSAMTVSRWERGVQQPPAGLYIQLGNLAAIPNVGIFGSAPDCTAPTSSASFRHLRHGQARRDFLPS